MDNSIVGLQECVYKRDNYLCYSLLLAETPKGITILDALSATGLRAVRYALEVPNVIQVIANDIDQTAVVAIKENAKLNGVSHLVSAVCNDATMLMHENKNYDRRYDVIDLDPFGSPTHFLDSAVQAVHNGGIRTVNPHV